MYTGIEKFKKVMNGEEISKQEGIFSLTVFASCLPCGFPPYISKYYDIDFEAFLFLYDRGHGALAFNFERYRDLSRKAGEKFLKVGSIPEQLDYIKNNNTIFELYRTLTPDRINALSDQELYVKIKDIYMLFFSVFTTTIFSEALDEDLVKELYQKLTGGLDHFQEFFAIVSRKNFESFVTRNARDLISYDEASNIYDFQWLTTNYFLTPRLPEVPQKLNTMITENGGIDGLKKIIEESEKELAENEVIITEYTATLSEGLKRLFEFVQYSISLRDLRKAALQRSIALITNVVYELVERMGEVSLAPFVLAHDFIYQDFNIDGYKETLQKRSRFPLLIYFDQGGAMIEYVDSEKAKAEFYDTVNPHKAPVSSITGSIGCKGVTRGSVKVVLSETHFENFKQGDVLVTSMTRPEFVPLMKKAIAVITDEGGITCHAAIISRELGVPCIIGTKIATQVLKDGDLVEVDADNGIVKILK